ncbi:MAG: calcium/sodium antiporter [bacterium]|nr:calcium/sodium antiporter [bacterium]
MDWIVYFWLAAGLALLIIGAETMVRGASSLAAWIGISPLVVGLTIVAYGTSAPELAVSLQAAAAGNGQIVLGNVIGSNIVNVLLILGASALIVPLVVERRLVRLEAPLLIGVSALTWFFAADGQVGRIEGLLLLTGAVLYTGFIVVQSRQETAAGLASGVSDRDRENNTDHENQSAGENDRDRESKNESAGESDSAPMRGGIALQILLILIGLGLLALGARWLVEGATAIARALGLSDLLIGLTVIAIGTSLPELATSIVAALRGERDLAVGNIIGSNLFNMLFVLGTSALLLPVPVSFHAIAIDLPIMFAAALACLPIFFTNYRIDRWEGALFLVFYAMYVAYLIASARSAGDWISLQTSILFFVAPITALVLIVSSIHSWGKKL